MGAFGYPSAHRQRSFDYLNREYKMVTPEQLKDWIETGFDNAQVSVEGDGHHFEAVIVANEFEGKSRIQRHQLVYAALGDKMKAEVHALSMKTLTPSEQA